MEFKIIEWDREKLFEQLWTAPTRIVAREYGLSDVGLAKICRKLQIPKPGVGYWRKKQCGFALERPKLPPLKAPAKLVSRIQMPAPPKPKETSDTTPEPLRIPPPSTVLHPMVRQTQRAFAKGSPDQFGRLRPSDFRLPHFDLRVTSSGLEKAVGFMDRLARFAEANEIRIVPASKERGDITLRFQVDGEEIRTFLLERVRGKRRDLTPAEKREHDQWPSLGRRDFAYVYVACNRFVFEIENYSDGQRKWAESEEQTIDDFIEPIIRSMRAAAVYEKQLRARRAAEHQRQLVEQRVRWKQQERIDRLRKNIEKWEEAQRVRAYLTAVREKVQAAEGEVKTDSPIARFLSWAQRYADDLDPSSAASDWKEDEP